MTTQPETRSERELRERVERQHGPIHQQDAPKTANEAAKLAREDPDKFNAMVEAGRIGKDVLAGKEAK